MVLSHRLLMVLVSSTQQSVEYSSPWWSTLSQQVSVYGVIMLSAQPVVPPDPNPGTAVSLEKS